MIDQVSIRNFRCFKHLKSLSLKRFNILVGESGSGKTTLLEALFLLGGGSPEIYFRLRNWRGFSAQIGLQGTRESYEALFRDLFFDFEQERGAVISAQDNVFGSRSLEISYRDKDEYSLDFSILDSHAFLIAPISFKWEIAGKVYPSSLEFNEGKFSIVGSAPVAPLVYFNPINTSSQQNASSFSALNRKFRAPHLVKTISDIFPAVRELSLEVVANEASLHVATDLTERLPLGDLSGGITKFVTIALGILANPGGTVIVDEIEGGFYYKNMPKIWAALVTLCKQENVQLVASTHSYEFLRAVAGTLKDKAISREMQFMRVEKSKDGEHDVTNVPTDAFDSALDYEIEVR